MEWTKSVRAEAPASLPGRLESGLARVPRNELVIEHLPVVMSVARRLLTRLPPSVDADDIYSVGVLGLIDAAERFDSNRDVKFRTYAEMRIKGAMLDYLRSLNWAPRRLSSQAREIARARAAIEARTGRCSNSQDIAEAIGVTLQQYHLLLFEINLSDLQNGDELWKNDFVNGPGPIIADEDGDPSLEVERKEMVEIVRQAVEALAERQRILLWLYYYEELTMKEIGAILKVNESRVSQIHSKAIAALRSKVFEIMNPQ